MTVHLPLFRSHSILHFFVFPHITFHHHLYGRVPLVRYMSHILCHADQLYSPGLTLSWDLDFDLDRGVGH